MAVAARVVRLPVDAAAPAAQHVSSQCRRAAPFNGGHDLELAKAQMPALLLALGCLMPSEDVGDLEDRPLHSGAAMETAASRSADHLAQHFGAVM
jgi:hypothetical protein